MNNKERVRTVLSPNSKYYISHHRMLELRHFCFQYNEFKMAADECYLLSRKSSSNLDYQNANSDPTGRQAVKAERYTRLMDMIDETIADVGGDYSKWLEIGVKEGRSYTWMSTYEVLPLTKEPYYLLLRKFYWVLDKRRDR